MSLPSVIPDQSASGRSEFANRTRGAAVCAAIGALCLTILAGCTGGFRPMYASESLGGAGVNFAQIDVTAIPGRIGQKIRNELVYQSRQANDGTVEPRYRLAIAVRESSSSSLVVSTGDARSATVDVNADFQLTRLSDNQPVLKGESYGRATYERVDSAYANVRARRDAADRAAATVARDLRSRLEAFLAGNPDT